jgi:UPF0716 protein FxsA
MADPERWLRYRLALRRFLWLSAVAFPFIELFAAIWLAGQIGWGWTLLLAAGLSVFGAWVLRDTARRARREAVAQSATPTPAALAQAGRLGVRTVAGLLLFLPGFLTGAAGLVLLFPPVAELVRRRTAATVRVRTTRFGAFPGWQGTVVAGEVLRDESRPDGPGDEPPGGPPLALPPGR